MVDGVNRLFDTTYEEKIESMRPPCIGEAEDMQNNIYDKVEPVAALTFFIGQRP